MATPGSDQERASFSAGDIARLANGSPLPATAVNSGAGIKRRLTMAETNRTLKADRARTRAMVIASVAALAVLSYLSLGIMGAMGQNYAFSGAYYFYSPVEVARALYEHAYNALAQVTHAWPQHSSEWIAQNVNGYWAVGHRAGVVGITLLCGILLSISGMLYQNVFRNPLAGPGMLGASSGVTLGIMILVMLYETAAPQMLTERYLYCYGLGAIILVLVILAGKKMSGKGKPFDIVSMLLIGSIFGQLAGFVQQYVILFLYGDDETIQNVFIELTQMLTVDTSALSFVVLLVAFAISFIPVYLMRYRMNALAFSEEEVRLFGINFTRIRALALVSGAIMMIAAQIHTGTVGMVSMIVPFMSRSWFGAEFSKQLTGNICIGTLLLLACRDITDCIPFVGDGLGIGMIVQLVAMPLFVIIMARHLNTWEG
ncbi:MAG: iron chelate uptake ABC transporter family permease subunit [Eggerthellaceae bacterium]|nr:iron chelate uptake ABC transporter family permease subunit [Eggerthellaceae bacterium]